MSGLTEKIIDSDVIYKGRILNLRLDTVTLPNGKKAGREVVEHPGAVTIAAVTGEKKIILVKQYRHPVSEVLLELPAGKLDSGEKPLKAAQRELKEETGWEAGEWLELSTFYTSPGFADEKMFLYLARNLNFSGQALDEDEFVKVVEIPLTEAVQKIRNGDIRDAKTIVGILTAVSIETSKV